MNTVPQLSHGIHVGITFHYPEVTPDFHAEDKVWYAHNSNFTFSTNTTMGVYCIIKWIWAILSFHIVAMKSSTPFWQWMSLSQLKNWWKPDVYNWRGCSWSKRLLLFLVATSRLNSLMSASSATTLTPTRSTCNHWTLSCIQVYAHIHACTHICHIMFTHVTEHGKQTKLLLQTSSTTDDKHPVDNLCLHPWP